MPARRPDIILASASPRRKTLLAGIYPRFIVRHPKVNEATDGLNEPWQVAEELARRKARSAAAGAPNALVISADTITVIGDEIVGKPSSPEHAVEILRRLSGTAHSVITGVCLIYTPKHVEKTSHEETRIRMRVLKESDIDEYVGSGEGMGKAGAYAIQETGDRFVEGYDGSFSNIVGLPVELTRRLIRELEEEGGFRSGMMEEAGAR